MEFDEAVREFHEAFGVGISATPNLPPDRIDLRIALLREELDEVVEAIGDGGMENVAKELADLLYVTIGAAVEFGIPIGSVFDEVHRSNMAKLWTDEQVEGVLADEGHPACTAEKSQHGWVVRRSDGKVLKPPDHRPPDLGGLLDGTS